MSETRESRWRSMRWRKTWFDVASRRLFSLDKRRLTCYIRPFVLRLKPADGASTETISSAWASRTVCRLLGRAREGWINCSERKVAGLFILG